MSAAQPLYVSVRSLLSRATELAVARGLLAEPVAPAQVALERPKQASHGDLATNLFFGLAKAAKANPRALAEACLPLLTEADRDGLLAGAEVAGPGFVNLRLSAAGWQSALTVALQAAEHYGQSSAGGGERVLLEFVSANPTGPMHVGHGRGAVLGDALARVLRAAGYRVDTEYYINNVGNQIAKLGESVWHWLRHPELRKAALATWTQGEPVAFPDAFPPGFPEDGYRGAYIAATAEALSHDPAVWHAAVRELSDWSDDAAWQAADPQTHAGRADDRSISIAAWKTQLARIQDDLQVLDIRFDRWFSERSLHGLDPRTGNAVADCARRLVAADWAYAEEASTAAAADGEDDSAGQGRAVFFRGTREDVPKQYRDGKDRVILRGDGRPTYFAADIAYHDDKLARGYDHLINVLGADHHGYVSRLKGVIHALGDLRGKEGDPRAARWSGDRLEVLLIQMVALLRDGKPVPMGKRSGEFVTLRDVVDEVTTAEPTSGRDAVRFTFLTRKADAQLDFDLEVARRTSMDNPVYYVQYGHARLSSILLRAEEAGQPLQPGAALDALQLDDERELALLVAEFPEVVARAARSREPHQLAYFLLDTCRAFHGYYSRHKNTARVISDDHATTQARLALVAALQLVLRNGLALLGVSAPERMVALPDSEESEGDAA